MGNALRRRASDGWAGSHRLDGVKLKAFGSTERPKPHAFLRESRRIRGTSSVGYVARIAIGCLLFMLRGPGP